MNKSIKRRFENAQKKYPELSDLVCFGRAVSGEELPRPEIYRLLGKLVPKSDYPAVKRIFLVSHFAYLSQTPQDEYILGG